MQIIDDIDQLSHPVLDRHDVIAWDMDQTLVDGPNSEFFREYIKATPQKTHLIVTFRDTAWAAEIDEELSSYDFNADQISTVINCPDLLWIAYQLNKPEHIPHRHRYPQLSVNDIHDAYHAVPLWKGKVSSEAGATILVDDMISMVEQGCRAHRVELLNSLEPI